MIKKQIIPTAEPYFMPGGKTACLLVHGFTGAPKEMLPMAEALHKQGLTVMGIRLAGHATQVEDMLRMKYKDWLVSVEDGISMLKGNYEHVFLAGLSMGGVLVLTAASYNEVNGVIALSAPYKLDHDWRLKFARPLSRVTRWVNKEDNSEKESDSDHIDYPVYPLHAIAELIDLTKVMREALPRIKAPVLLINSKADKTVSLDNAENIKARLTSKNVEQLILERSGHVITEGVEREIAFEAAYRFYQETQLGNIHYLSGVNIQYANRHSNLHFRPTSKQYIPDLRYGK